MKTTKSPEDSEVTPSKKKLKQARLPFKLLSEVSPSPVTPPTRKRKLSASNVETASKVGKISKENGVSEDPVVISDDEAKNDKSAENPQKLPNPYVRLVDKARKKRLQKAKGSKKRKGGKLNSSKDLNISNNETANGDSDCEKMEVDDPEINTNETETKAPVDNIIVLEDSNQSTDNTQAETKGPEQSCDIDELVSNNKSSEDDKRDESPQNSDEETVESSESEHPKSNLNQDSTNEELLVTPKRSLRSKAKVEENNNSKGSPSSKLNESATSNPCTPKQSRSSSVTKHEESLNESVTSNTTLTPKQMQKKLESAKKREEREKEKVEKEKKRLQEKEERAKQKQEKEDQKKREREEKEEAKRKEREEKEELKKKEKEEKEEQKRKEKEEKEKLKEEKEEQKRKEKEARDEEKRKKQEALDLEKQEQELKKKKAAEAFVNFFVPKQKVEKDQPTVGEVSNTMLSSFTLKSDMRLAPTTRVNLTEDRIEQLEKVLEDQGVDENALYLRSLKSGSKPMTCGKTWPLNDKNDDDVILVEDELPPLDGTGESIAFDQTTREKLRPKLFSFHENRRPPYWGTWRKKSAFIKPRKPFNQDEKQLDYEVDSDDDWEEDQEGESIDGSVAGSDDEQGPDEYEVDNEVFVPHGYLSDEEATMDEDDVLSLSPETQKTRLKNLEDEFESEMKKPTEKLKPRLYGLLWENDGGKPDNCADAIWNYFGKLAMVMNDPTPFLKPSENSEEQEKKKVKKKKSSPEGEQNGQKPEKKKRSKPEEKEGKPKLENKKVAQEAKKNQPGINMFLTKKQS